MHARTLVCILILTNVTKGHFFRFQKTKAKRYIPWRNCYFLNHLIGCDNVGILACEVSREEIPGGLEFTLKSLLGPGSGGTCL